MNATSVRHSSLVRREELTWCVYAHVSTVTSMSGVIPRGAGAAGAPQRVERGGVQMTLDRLDHQPHRVVRRQPVPHVGGSKNA